MSLETDYNQVAYLTSTRRVQTSSRSFPKARRRAANLACRSFGSRTYRAIRSFVRLNSPIGYYQGETKISTKIAHLSFGASLSSHLTTAEKACRHTSTKVGFFSSAIALVSSPIWDLYNAGQCFETNPSNSCAF
jgi:hypothetical protein